jgi:hypothetical protein
MIYTVDNVLDFVKITTGTNLEDDIIHILIDRVECEFLTLTGQIDIPNSATGLITDMVLERYNKLGAEGLQSQSYSNISEHYKDGYSAGIQAQLRWFRKVKLL